MVGNHLHAFDLQLCDYLVGNIVQHMDRPEYSAELEAVLTCRPLLDYLKQANDKSLDAEDVRLLLNNEELNRLELTFEGELDRRWEPYEALHRRYIKTVKEVRDNVSRQAAEDWSEDCARYARQLEGGRTRLSDGITIIREWVRRLRTILHVMGNIDLLPQPEGRFPTPTHPETLPISSAIQSAPSGAPANLRHPSADLDSKGLEIARPANPTRAYCLVPPNIILWDGETEVQQRLWHLLGVLLAKGVRVEAETIEEVVSPFKKRKGKCLPNDVSELNKALEKIKWPVIYHFKSGYVVASA